MTRVRTNETLVLSGLVELAAGAVTDGPTRSRSPMPSVRVGSGFARRRACASGIST